MPETNLIWKQVASVTVDPYRPVILYWTSVLAISLALEILPSCVAKAASSKNTAK